MGLRKTFLDDIFYKAYTKNKEGIVSSRRIPVLCQLNKEKENEKDRIYGFIGWLDDAE